MQEIPSRSAQAGELQHELHPAVWAALQAGGVNRLFSHQAEAASAILEGRNAVVATSTASGKSLCYNVPVLQALATDPTACVLYIFPTKALAQDQRRALTDLLQAAFGDAAPAVEVGIGGHLQKINFCMAIRLRHFTAVTQDYMTIFEAHMSRSLFVIQVYDGDTLQSDRPLIRDRARLLITNPDMLHMSMLPVHSQFARLLSGLRYVVLDEGHAYKGVFGCHTAMVMRRLRR